MLKLPVVTFVLGTRPEAIKLAPVIIAFKSCTALETRVILTGQHNEMLKQVMEFFELKADLNLNLMSHNQTLTEITCKTLEGLKQEFKQNPTNLVLVQGDTSTAFSAALAAFYEKIPVAHIEAGLRTENLMDPFPEEANRRLISQIATLHFAPTKKSMSNLKRSFISANIEVTGNTVIDSLQSITNSIVEPSIDKINWQNQKVILSTIHRRENWGKRLEDIARGMLMILQKYSDTSLLIPMHKNKIVRESILRILGNHPRVALVEPLIYKDFIGALKSCTLLLTDSGGLQEEAPTFSKPVLVLRETTERSEAIDAGIAKLVGYKAENIFAEASILLENPRAYKRMSEADNPFGDGKASQRILKKCLELLS